MSNLSEPFKVEYMEEYLQMSLESFKLNNPLFTLGMTKEEEFL
jgi:hypothetical protein